MTTTTTASMDVRDRHRSNYGDQSMSSRDVPGTMAQLRQTERTGSRSKAIAVFCKGLRRGPQFQPFWDAVGGAAGLASLMAEFSLRDVRAMCRGLGSTASAQKARAERQAGLAELVRLLYEEGGPAQRDPRPLRKYYRDIVPACNLELVREWDDDGRAEWTNFQRVFLFRSHRAWYQSRFLEGLSSYTDAGAAAQRTSFTAESRLFQGDLAFSNAILSTLLMADRTAGSPIPIPPDFMSGFAMPLLRRLVRRWKYNDETRDKFLCLVVQYVSMHAQELARHSGAAQEELVRYAIQRWSAARVGGPRAATTATKEKTELCVGRLIETMPPRRKQLESLQRIFDGLLLDRKTHVDSYQLLRLILRHARGYELDIDDGTSLGLSRLGDLAARGNLWPAKLFLYLDAKNALGLFERLSAADVTGDFLTQEQPSRSSTTTILEQSQDLYSGRGDAEIVRYLLLSKSKKIGADGVEPTWLAHARTLIHERRKKSQEGREWQQREFWATSAINLCVAAGDLETLDDTILWARRFNNQPLVARGLYGPSTFGTDEIRDLLSAVPSEDNRELGDAPDWAQVALVTQAIELSGRIIVHLMETIKMSLSQPQSENKHWQTLLRLPKLVVDHRLEKKHAAYFDALFEPTAPGSDYIGRGAVEMVWKTTVDTLVKAEGLLSSSHRLRIQATGAYTVQKLPGRSGDIRADVTSFLFERMKMYLGPEGLRLQMPKVVELITSVAQSDQPWLAIPFIRDVVLDGDGADSVWHRKLLSAQFLSTLPYKAAGDLLHTMADAMRERMRKQNADPREDKVGGDGVDDAKKAVPNPPAIKVTTIKMMARLLQDSQIIGASTACDMLVGLLAEARHIDTLVALVSSLLSFLKGPTYSPEIQTRILDALEQKLSSVLSQLSQRRPLTEADWAAVESGEADLPDIADDQPLLSLLISQDYDSEVMSREARARLIDLLVRVPTESALHNARWNKAFLARNGFSLDDGEFLPAAPACIGSSVDLLSRFPARIPTSIIIALRDMTLLNLDPTPGILRVTEAVRASRVLVNSNAGRHWLAQFGNPGLDALQQFGILEITSVLQRPAGDLGPSEGDDGGRARVQIMGESVLAVAYQTPGTVEKLATHLSMQRLGSRAGWLAWRENCVPILEAMATEIDRLHSSRSSRLRDDKKPVPRALPSSFRPRLSVLPFPYSNPPKEPALLGEVEAFVQELAELVEWLVRRGVPYHDELAQLKIEMRRSLSHDIYGRVALRLGELSSGGGDGTEAEEEGGRRLTMADYLRLELAGKVLVDTVDPLDEGCGVLPELKQMVRGWVDSDDEVVRRTGLSVENKHKALFS